MSRPYRQFPRRRGPVTPLASQAPYLSYWVQPVNEPQRANLKRLARQQPPENEPPPLRFSEAPYLSYWVQPTGEPQRANLRRLARQQPAPLQPPPLRTSNAPDLTEFVHPTNQPLKNRVPKRTQVNKAAPPFPPIASEAPYVSYWAQPVNQPQRANLRKLARQQPFYLSPTWPPKASEPPDVSQFIQPVNQPLKSRVPKRLQVNKFEPPFPALPSQPPYVDGWIQRPQLPQRKQKRQQPQYPSQIFDWSESIELPTDWMQQNVQPYPRRKRQQPTVGFNSYYGIPVNTTPSVASWKHPVEQPRRVPKRQQPPATQLPVLRFNEPPYLSYWVQPVNQFPKARTPRRMQVNKFVPPFISKPSPVSSAPKIIFLTDGRLAVHVSGIVYQPL